MTKPTVLILASEPVVAALLGMLLELEDIAPVFAEAGERPEDAVARLRPPVVILLDAAEDIAESDIFFARAARARATVIFFASDTHRARLEALAVARDTLWFTLPIDRATLATVLSAAFVAR